MGQLVRPEQISCLADWLRDLPDTPAVYSLHSGGKCVYVGSSVNLRQRFATHQISGKFDLLDWTDCREEDLEREEKALFDALSPTLNKVVPRRPRRTPRAWAWNSRYQRWDRIHHTASSSHRERGACVAIERPSAFIMSARKDPMAQHLASSRKKVHTPAVQYPEGEGKREVCSSNAAGRREYRHRVELMWERQEGLCALCVKPLRLDEATFDHEFGRGMGGSRRDDRITIWGKPYNAAVHGLCNAEKGSRAVSYLIQPRAEFGMHLEEMEGD